MRSRARCWMRRFLQRRKPATTRRRRRVARCSTTCSRPTPSCTGHMKLHLWVEAVGANDMDLFVGIQKLDRRGEIVPFVFYALMENGPVALGWLRASHRDLDPVRSTPEQPGAYPHVSSRLRPVSVCRWKSKSGRRRHCSGRASGYDLSCRGRTSCAKGCPMRRSRVTKSTRNHGTHVIHTGQEFDSYLPGAGNPTALVEHTTGVHHVIPDRRASRKSASADSGVIASNGSAPAAGARLGRRVEHEHPVDQPPHQQQRHRPANIGIRRVVAALCVGDRTG